MGARLPRQAGAGQPGLASTATGQSGLEVVGQLVLTILQAQQLTQHTEVKRPGCIRLTLQQIQIDEYSDKDKTERQE